MKNTRGARNARVKGSRAYAADRAPQSALCSRLRQRISEEGSQAQVAKRARVSTGTINQVLKGDFATDPVPQKAEATQLRGYAEALTRLSTYLGLDVWATLSEYGIEPTDAIELAVMRARREATPPRLRGDPVIADIIGRATEEYPGVVSIGLALSPQFHSRESKEGLVFAQRYMARLIGSINPMWGLDPHTLDNIPQCIDALLPSSGDDRGKRRVRPCDVVFGLYDTPYRQFRELDFLFLPGIRLPLGAVTTSNASMNWRGILGLGQVERPFALVLREEAGHLFLQGPCQFHDKEDLRVLDVDSAHEMAAAFAYALTEWRERRAVIFVAEHSMCRRVLDSLQADAWSSSRVTSARPQPRITSDDLESVGLVDVSQQDTPRYKVGIAVRRDAREWLRLIKVAEEHEIFGNALPLTAQLYADLFRLKRENMIWEWDDFQPGVRRRFEKLVETSVPPSLLPPGWFDQTGHDQATQGGDTGKGESLQECSTQRPTIKQRREAT